MENKLQRYIKTAGIVYDKQGFKGLCRGMISKVELASLPIIYSVHHFRNSYHPKLQTVYLELTNKCNLRCEMCNWQSRKKTGYISKSLFESCIDQFSEMGLNVLNLQFAGESLLHPDFEDLLRYAIDKRDNGKIGCIGWTDNGMLFNESVSDLVLSLNVDWINFSLDGIGAVNDNIRLGSNYSVIEKNIKYLLEKRGYRKKPALLLNMVDHKKSEAQKLEFYGKWVSLVDEIELIPCILPDNTWENEEIFSKSLRTIPPPKFCNTPFNTMIISWDGEVTYCCFDSCFKTVLGNANKESILKIWNASKFQNLRKNILRNTIPIGSPCHGCRFWQVNFEPRKEIILDGKAMIEYGYVYRRIRKITEA